MNQQDLQPSEVQSTVTLQDFSAVFWRYRRFFAIGLVIVAGGTFLWTKFMRTKYFQATATFSVMESMTATSRAGIADTQIFEPNRTEKYLYYQTVFAEQVLFSRELIVEATRRMAEPTSGSTAYRLYSMLNIEESDPGRRDDLLTRLFQESLMKVVNLRSSGVMTVSVELPDPVAAARFVNLAIDLLQQRITEMNFRYLDKLVALYQQDLSDRLEMRQTLADELLELQRTHQYDVTPNIAARRDELKKRLDLQAEALGELNTQISQITLAASPQARQAAQPVEIISRAWPPLKKSRPQTILTTLMATLLYGLVFMGGMVVAGYFAARERRRATPQIH
jgi:uncharacterized protein involved in exopolysaccharide biosynthesis